MVVAVLTGLAAWLAYRRLRRYLKKVKEEEADIAGAFTAVTAVNKRLEEESEAPMVEAAETAVKRVAVATAAATTTAIVHSTMV